MKNTFFNNLKIIRHTPDLQEIMLFYYLLEIMFSFYNSFSLLYYLLEIVICVCGCLDIKYKKVRQNLNKNMKDKRKG